MLEREAFVRLQRTAGLLMDELATELKPFGLTATHFNVLRILRGAREGGLNLGEIAARMIRREPDMTRLIERMAKRGWVTRERGENDRRQVRVRISGAGETLLGQVDPVVARFEKQRLKCLPAADLAELIRMLDTLRER